MKILMQNIGMTLFTINNVVGTNFFVQTLELAQTLQDIGYGQSGEIVGFDLYPYTEDQVAAVRRAILHWEFIWDLAEKIDREALRQAKANADALASQKAVYAALGLDADHEAQIVKRRREAREARVGHRP